MMWFKQRNKLGKEVEKWMAENNAANVPLTTITYLVIKGWLKDRPIECKNCIHYQEGTPELDGGWCEAWGAVTAPNGWCHEGEGRII